MGLFVGGGLGGGGSWGVSFVINLPLAALVVAVTLRHVPESRDPGATAPVDASGGVLVTAGLIGLTYGLIQGPVNGWASTPVLAALIVGVLLLGVFRWWERPAPAPMLSLCLFPSPHFTATNVVTFIIYCAIGGALVLLPLPPHQVSPHTAPPARVLPLPVPPPPPPPPSRPGAPARRVV